jgi:hypothetical protein
VGTPPTAPVCVVTEVVVKQALFAHGIVQRFAKALLPRLKNEVRVLGLLVKITLDAKLRVGGKDRGGTKHDNGRVWGQRGSGAGEMSQCLDAHIN